jgi:subtilisin family serine protease
MTKVTQMIACPGRARSRQARSSNVLLILLTLLPLAAPLANATAQAQSVSPLPGEGAQAHRADWVSNTYNVKGEGVTVCVLSDSIDNGQGVLAAARAGGALPPVPPAGQQSQLLVVPNEAGDATGEGAAMLEIIYKIAPRAKLVFATGRGGTAHVAENIRTLVSPQYGCQIIVDDIFFRDEAPFQDGDISIAINEAAAKGVLVISAAGNYGNSLAGTSGTWEGDFADGGASPITTTGIAHRFAPGKLYATLTKATSLIALYWNDEWSNRTSTYALFVTNENNAVIAYQQGSTGHPYQYVEGNFQPGARIWVIKGARSPSRYLRIATLSSSGQSGQIDVGTEASVFGHSAASNVLSVGAVDLPIPLAAYSRDRDIVVNSNTADGPRRIFYKADKDAITSGNLLKATNGGSKLLKPDLAAAHCVTTTVFTTSFCGTSAAAPHVAGIAALLKSYKPSLKLTQLRLALLASTLRVKGQASEWDSRAGAGVVMADKAFKLAESMNQPAPVPSDFQGAELLQHAKDPNGWQYVYMSRYRGSVTIGARLNRRPAATPDNIDNPSAVAVLDGIGYVLDGNGRVVSWNILALTQQKDFERRNCHPDC